jgi:effector-binding domain-containing protein
MIHSPRVREVPSQRAAVIRLTIPRARIREVLGPARAALRTALAAQGIAPEGPTYARHLRVDPGTFDFELGVPVARPVAISGRVRPGALPAATVASAVYIGPYDGLDAAWDDLDDWIAAHHLIPLGELWEVFLVGAELAADPAAYRTELQRPLAPR